MCNQFYFKRDPTTTRHRLVGIRAFKAQLLLQGSKRPKGRIRDIHIQIYTYKYTHTKLQQRQKNPSAFQCRQPTAFMKPYKNFLYLMQLAKNTMAEKCKEHTKDSVTRCLWCNAPLCSICVSLKEGKKHYCRKCHRKLSEHISEKNLRKAEAESSVPEMHSVFKKHH